MPARLRIGVLAPLLGGEYFGALISGIGAVAAEGGADLLAIQTTDARHDHDHQADGNFAARVGWQHIEGFVAIVDAVSPGYLAAIRAAGKPVVLISHEVAGFECPVVVPDNRSGIRAAVTHLVEHGHTRIAFAGTRNQPDIRERWEAYCDVLREHGIEPDPRLDFSADANNYGGGRQAGHALIAAGLPSTAVLAATDYLAFGLMEVLSDAGLQLPRDQAIVSFDDTPNAANSRPSLSSVAQDFVLAGRTAAMLLIEQIVGRVVAPGKHHIATTFIPRESCGCAAPVPIRQQDSSGLGPVADRLVRALLALRPDLGASVETPAAAAEQAACERVVEIFCAVGRGAPRPPGPTIAHALDATSAAGASRAAVLAVLAVVQELELELLSAAGDDPAVGAGLKAVTLELTGALLELQLRGQYHVNRNLRVSMQHEYDITLDLLRRDETDPRALGWLACTRVSAAWMGEWAAETSGAAPMMRIAGSYEAHQGHDDLTGHSCDCEAFPPTELLASVGEGDVVFLLPLRTRARDWGFLAVVGPVEAWTDTGRETYFQWAALLSVALDHEAVVQSLRSQRADLATAYNRERGLVENIRASEERYALATRAANDGLWDWDLQTGEIFYSARWKQMLGYDDATIGARPDDWFDRVHPDDLAGLLESIKSRIGGEINSFEYEHRVRAGSGNYLWMLCRALAVPGGGQPTVRMVGSLTDMTERKELEDRLRQGALYDALTGLPNRTLFLDRLDRAIAHSKRRQEYRFLVLFLDLDGFKVVNDSLGHLAGDKLLVQVAERIRSQLRDSDTAARFGGDEFAILLNDVTDVDVVPVIVDRLQAALARAYQIDGHEVVVSASIGIAASTTGYDLPEDVLRDSDIAMYRAKSTERGTYATFDVSMHARAVTRMRVESDLRRAIEHREFELHYQPIVELGTHRIEALESLVRWRHPERGLLAPGDFLPVAEESGLIVAVGRLVVEQVCEQLAQWSAAGVSLGDVRVSVNVSNREFWHADFQAHLDASLEVTGASPEWFNLEITEGVIMHNPELAQRMLLDLRAKGFHLHIDDFGTGYSSLDALHRFPIEALKIDRSFVSRLETDRKSRELVRTIILMGRSLEMDVIAEGIESDAQDAILQGLGCEYGQGFWFARPLAAGAARALLDGREAVAAHAPRPPAG